MYVCLVRHGQTDWNQQRRIQGREDIPLNETGMAEARAAGNALKKIKWNKIVSSPLSRAVKTALLMGEALGIDAVEKYDGFVERDYGELSGVAKQECGTHYKGIEPIEDLKKRMVDGLISFTSRDSHENIIIVSHGGAINALLAALSNGETGTGKLTLKNGCLTMLEIRDGKTEILCCNKSAQEFTELNF